MVKKIGDGQYKCCGKIMNAYSTTISHTCHLCLKCGKRVQVKGGWGKGIELDGFENPHAFVQVVD